MQMLTVKILNSSSQLCNFTEQIFDEFMSLRHEQFQGMKASILDNEDVESNQAIFQAFNNAFCDSLQVASIVESWQKRPGLAQRSQCYVCHSGSQASKWIVSNMSDFQHCNFDWIALNACQSDMPLRNTKRSYHDALGKVTGFPDGLACSGWWICWLCSERTFGIPG